MHWSTSYVDDNYCDFFLTSDHAFLWWICAGPACTLPETEPIPLIDNHVTVLSHTNHERKILQETPI